MALLIWSLHALLVAPAAAEEAANVTLPEGAVVRGSAHRGIWLYSGLQYAQAGRFEAPQLWATVAGTVVDAREPDKTICPQMWTKPVGQEDCLKLDVYKPPNATNAAVMVWIHGGGLTLGGKHFLDLSNFVLEGQVVVVAINYRLNVLGFFTSPNQSEPSNFGIRDQIAGLQWVQQNIAAFGGDPTRVTIFGQSAGGLSVTVLLQSPLARGLFHQAIAQSPAWQTPALFQQSAADAGRTMGQSCLEAAGCETAACLKHLSWVLLAQYCDSYLQPAEFLSQMGMVFTGFDAQVLKQPLYKSACSAEPFESAAVPLLVGTTSHEWRSFQWMLDASFVIQRFFSQNLPGYASGSSELQTCAWRKVMSLYPGLGEIKEVEAATDMTVTIGAQLAASVPGGARYRYLLDVEPGVHSLDLAYFTDDPSQDQAAHLSINDSEANRFLGKQLREYWTSFAKSGMPTSSRGPDWQRASDRQHGTPLLRFQLGSGGNSNTAMDSSAWFSNATAEMLHGIACGRVQLTPKSPGGCDLIPVPKVRRLGSPLLV